MRGKSLKKFILFCSFLFSFILLSNSVYAEKLKVVTYNTGLIRKVGINMAPCVIERVAPQLKAIFQEDKFSLFKTEESFVIALQEVWTKRAFLLYRSEAKKRGLSSYPNNFTDIKNNGQLLITNLEIIDSDFLPFKNDKYAEKGIRFISAKMPITGQVIKVANIHTNYSDSKTFTQEHKDHFSEVVDFSISEGSSKLILAGDFNAGPNFSFKKQKYNVAKKLWFGQDGIFSKLNQINMKLASDPSLITWDDANNKMVTNAALPVKLLNGALYKTFEWEENSSTLDHIFVSEELDVLSANINLNRKVEIKKTCWGRLDNGRGNLSDHYAVEVILDI